MADEPPPEVLRMFLDNSVDLMALVRAYGDHDIRMVNNIMDEYSCCTTHMGFLAMGAISFARHVIDHFTETEEEFDEFLQDTALQLTKMREQFNA